MKSQSQKNLFALKKHLSAALDLAITEPVFGPSVMFHLKTMVSVSTKRLKSPMNVSSLPKIPKIPKRKLNAPKITRVRATKDDITDIGGAK